MVKPVMSVSCKGSRVFEGPHENLVMNGSRGRKRETSSVIRLKITVSNQKGLELKIYLLYYLMYEEPKPVNESYVTDTLNRKDNLHRRRQEEKF